MPTPKQEIEIYDRLIVERTRDLMKNDSSLSKEDAEDLACTEIRREIRSAVAKQL